jgi:hypothetical protein
MQVRFSPEETGRGWGCLRINCRREYLELRYGGNCRLGTCIICRGILLAKYFAGDHIDEDEIGWACSTDCRFAKCVHSFGFKPKWRNHWVTASVWFRIGSIDALLWARFHDSDPSKRLSASQEGLYHEVRLWYERRIVHSELERKVKETAMTYLKRVG